jgi:hypothetical protein
VKHPVLKLEHQLFDQGANLLWVIEHQFFGIKSINLFKIIYSKIGIIFWVFFLILVHVQMLNNTLNKYYVGGLSSDRYSSPNSQAPTG